MILPLLMMSFSGVSLILMTIYKPLSIRISLAHFKKIKIFSVQINSFNQNFMKKRWYLRIQVSASILQTIIQTTNWYLQSVNLEIPSLAISLVKMKTRNNKKRVHLNNSTPPQQWLRPTNLILRESQALIKVNGTTKTRVKMN